MKTKEESFDWSQKIFSEPTYEIAVKNQISLLIEKEEQVFPLLTQEVLKNLKLLISNIVEFLPEHAGIMVRNCPRHKSYIEVINTGIDLSRYTELISELTLPASIQRVNAGSGTRFTIQVYSPKNKAVAGAREHQAFISPYYSEIRSQITKHWGQKNAFKMQLDMVLNHNYTNHNFNLQAWARLMALSTTQLFRKMKDHHGISPGRYLTLYRLKKAKEKLITSEDRIGEICLTTGFKSLSHFNRAFKKQFKLNPSAFRKNHTASTK